MKEQKFINNTPVEGFPHIVHHDHDKNQNACTYHKTLLKVGDTFEFLGYENKELAGDTIAVVGKEYTITTVDEFEVFDIGFEGGYVTSFEVKPLKKLMSDGSYETWTP